MLSRSSVQYGGGTRLGLRWSSRPKYAQGYYSIIQCSTYRPNVQRGFFSTTHVCSRVHDRAGTHTRAQDKSLRLAHRRSVMVWPTSLMQQAFGGRFAVSTNPSLELCRLASLQQSWFRFQFNQSIVGVVWPPSLQQLLSFWASIQPTHRRCCVAGFPATTIVGDIVTSTDPSMELCDRPPCSGYRSAFVSTKPSVELCGWLAAKRGVRVL